MLFGKGAYMAPHLPGKPSTLSCLIPPLLKLLQSNLCTVLRMADGVRIFQGLRLCLAVGIIHMGKRFWNSRLGFFCSIDKRPKSQVWS